MTWLGKILAPLVMVLALAWMYFTANVYVTRTNWKNEADKYKKAYQEAIAAREAEYRVYQTADTALTSKLAAEQTSAAAKTSQISILTKANTDNVASMKLLSNVIENEDIKSVQLAANYDTAIKNESTLRARADTLEVARNSLALEVEKARQDRLLAQNDLKLAMARQEEAERKLEVTTSDLRDLLAQGGRLGLGGGGGPAAAAGTRGTVTKVDGDLVELSLGLDAGLQAGMKLDLMRVQTGTYLGTVTIQANGLEPKRSVATFTPADPRVPMSRLRPDQLPKTGDQVGKLDTSRLSSR